MVANGQFYTYILSCADGSLYTGWTVDLEKRLQAHNSGQGAKYTRGRLPVQILAYWTFNTKVPAMQLEWKLKRLSRSQKLAFINSPLQTGKVLPNLSG